jgi:hypothetical protein
LLLPLTRPLARLRSAAEGVAQAAPNVAEPAPLPFHLCRSQTGQLPVYTKISNGHMKHTTVLRKYTGDVQALRVALRQMLHEKTGRELDVTMYNGRMEVHGHHVKLIKSWLRQLGF